MRIRKEYFEKHGKEKSVYLFTLINEKGTEIKITNYGGIVTSIKTADKNKRIDDIVLGFDNLEQYENEHPFFGVICGRYANRISNAGFSLNGKTYNLAANDGKNTLHGGIKGFDKVIWQAGSFENENEAGVKLNYLSPHLEEGFPGNLNVEVNYVLNNLNEFTILYSAKTDEPTVVNLTSHCYFNLNGCKKEIYDHFIKINADNITEADNTRIPTGKIIPVADTALDFRKEFQIGKKIDKIHGGYDHNYVLNKIKTGELAFAVKLYDPESGRTLEVYTTEPGIQFYSGNYLNENLNGKTGIKYKKHFGLCLEAQHFPDSPNNPEFPSTLLNPDKTYFQKTIYKFGVEK